MAALYRRQLPQPGRYEQHGIPRGKSVSRDIHPVTPDGRYFVVRGRLWRRSNPALPEERRATLVSELMAARRAVGVALRKDDASRLTEARSAADRAKIALGERGPVWWDDGEPDLNRHMAVNTPYAAWFERQDQTA